MAGFDTRNALNLAIRHLTKTALERNAGGWIPPKEEERQRKDQERQQIAHQRDMERQNKEYERKAKEEKREHEKSQKLLSEQFPTHYMPEVDRQVMADGGKTKKHPALSIPGVHIREEEHGQPIFTGRL